MFGLISDSNIGGNADLIVVVLQELSPPSWVVRKELPALDVIVGVFMLKAVLDRIVDSKPSI